MNSRPTAGIQSHPSHQVANDGIRRPPTIPRVNSHTSSASAQLPGPVVDLKSEGDKGWSCGKKETEAKAGTLRNELRDGDGSVGGSQPELGASKQDLEPSDLGKGDQAFHSTPTHDQSNVSRSHPLLAFPMRPGNSRSMNNAGGANHEASQATTPQNTGIDPPAFATLLPGDNFWQAGSSNDKTRRGACKVADFFSWQAKHPEDALTEHVIKSGFFDKPSNPSYETNTARPSLWSHLKSKQGLQTLSSLLVTVLEKRQGVGHITTGSTFKPPPRITMPDTRRESWLRDLANPNVPVRRQSKHVPHGIKGKALLEQCLNKNIPIPRAVWLVKCIGANEIRGLKRRGVSGAFAMGGELKWVKEWTVFVQQFIDSLIGLCRQQGWQQKMQYGTRLATQIFEERLLDREQYLDWLLTSLETAKHQQIPMWLLLAQIYWRYLVSNRQRGKRLAEALLGHLDSILAEGVDTVYQALIDRLRVLLATLIVSHRGCLILPATWEKYKHLFQARAEQSSEPKLIYACANLESRNKRLICKSSESPSTHSNPTRALVALLDAYEQNTSFSELSVQCLALFSDRRQLIAAVMTWASSKYRAGDHRIYLVARLLRNWQAAKVDLDDAMLSFLRFSAISVSLCQTNIFRILAELVRSGHFSMGRYLQWLVSEGCLVEDNECKFFHMQLLAELPTQRLPKHIVNLRQSLLQANRGFAHQNHDSGDDFTALSQRVPNLFLRTGADPTVVSVKHLNIPTKLELGRRLRQRIQELTKPNDLSKLKARADEPTVSEEVSAISNEDFCASRELLEDCNDFAILADVISVTISSNDESVLASVTDTLHCHARTFAAIGAFNPLSKIIIERYCYLRMRRATSRDFLLTLRDLIPIIQCDPRIPLLVERDLARCDQKTAVAVCSPVSDTNETLQPSKLDPNEEIERIFLSGNSMDEPTMSRLFQKIAARMKQHVNLKGKGVEAANFSCWLYWLRTFDEKKFELLVHNWLLVLLEEGHREHLHHALCSLAGAGCLSLGSFIDSTAVLQHQNKLQLGLNLSHSTIEDTSALVLNMLIPQDVPLLPYLHAPDAYRLRVSQQMYCRNNSKTVLGLVQRALGSTDIATIGEALNDRVLGFVAQHLALDSNAVITAFEPSRGSAPVALDTKRLADKMVEAGGSSGFAQLSFRDQVGKLVELADDLSLPVSILALRQLSRIFELDPSKFSESDANGSEVFSIALEAVVGAGSSTWPDLLQVMPLEIAQKVREHAEDTILSISSGAVGETDLEAEQNAKALERFMSLVEATSQIPVSPERAAFAETLTRQLKAIAETIIRPEDHLKDVNGSTPSFVHLIPHKRPWLNAILYLINTNKALFFSDGSAAPDAQKRLVDVLCTLLREPRLHTCPDLTEHIFDLLVSFSDHLSPDLRSHFSELYASSSSADPRFAFLFGSSTPPDAWLALAQPCPVPTTPVAAAAATGSMGPPPQQSLARSHLATAKQQEWKTTAFVLNRWELLQAPPPIGENDTSLSLSLFGARQK
ncbi:hypothetical protein EV356DRAFT_497442 [Viridothelium virens]|uniref:Mediator of RNA polymerase II transcription subunit 12 n=1 Tax=Viridothelium virens TaxID=1048519 RepID=A0A6A6GSS0_VIRVR|nr:hypothetical protein EV356DRAFT_497442 [Viridothelium virens]